MVPLIISLGRRPPRTTRLTLDAFLAKLYYYLVIFSKFCRRNSSLGLMSSGMNNEASRSPATSADNNPVTQGNIPHGLIPQRTNTPILRAGFELAFRAFTHFTAVTSPNYIPRLVGTKSLSIYIHLLIAYLTMLLVPQNGGTVSE